MRKFALRCRIASSVSPLTAVRADRRHRAPQLRDVQHAPWVARDQVVAPSARRSAFRAVRAVRSFSHSLTEFMEFMEFMDRCMKNGRFCYLFGPK